MITDLEPDILECEVKWALESITTNKANGSTHKFQVSVYYRLNSTRSKYKGTGAGKDAQERMKS